MTETLTISGRGVEREQSKTTQQPESFLPLFRSGGEGRGGEALFDFVAPQNIIYAAAVNPISNARRLRHEQTDEEKELWQALRAGRFAGFKFRRQHPLGN
jgi:hypothetical protein